MFNRVEKLLILCSEMVDVYWANPEVMMLDCTYNINAYNRPLLDFVSVTGGGKIAHSGFAMLDGESEESHAWFAVIQRHVQTQ